MSNIVQTFRSYTPGNVPTALLPGQFAVNIPDNKTWMGDANGVPVLLGGCRTLSPYLEAVNPPIIPIGTSDVVVSGGNFDPLTEVMFSNGIVVNSVYADSDSQLTVNVTATGTEGSTVISALNCESSSFNDDLVVSVELTPPVFDSLTHDPFTYEMLGVKTGVGGLSAVSSTTHYAPDHLGVYQQFDVNTPVWSGGRVTLTGGAGSLVDKIYADDGSGNLLPDTPYLQYYPEATNAQIQSYDLTNAEWGATTTTTALDETGVDGMASKATTLTATAANSTVIANAITAASDTQATCWYVKRKTGTGTVEVTVDGGTTWQALTLTTSFVKFTKDQATVTNPQIGIRIVTPADAVIVGNAECHTAKAIAQVRGLAPIFTEAAAVTQVATQYSFDVANVNNEEAAWYYETVITYDSIDGYHSGLDVYDISFGSSSNCMGRTRADIRFREQGGTNFILWTNDWVKDVSYKHGYSHSTAENKKSGNRDGVWAAESTFLSFAVSSFTVGMSITNACWKIRNLQRYDITSYQEGKDIIDRLMT